MRTPSTAELAASDESLLDAWQAGDSEAGEALFHRHFDTIYRFFRSKCTDDVADLVQRTLLGCVEAAPRFRREASVRTLLLSIARHELHGYFRSKKRNAGLDFTTTSVAALAPSPSSLVAREEEISILREALRKIPLELQTVLELYYWEDLPARELAFILEIPEGTVRSRIRRAAEALRSELTATILGSASDDSLAEHMALLRKTVGGVR